MVTAHGGMTSPRGGRRPRDGQAVRGRRRGRPDRRRARRRMTIGDTVVKEGDVLTIDGATGDVILGACRWWRRSSATTSRAIGEWADGRRRLGVRANADTPEDAARAREFGAEGIGLCRTEHMFMARERLPVVREMILADDDQGRAKALEKLLPMQQQDFAGIFRAMAGLPVTIRLLDPPLHEFLPDRIELADSSCARPPRGRSAPARAARARVRSLLRAEPDARAPAAAASAWCTPRSTRCRCGPSSAARSRRPRTARPRRGRDHDPAGGLRRGAGAHAPAGRARPSRRSSRPPAPSCRTWSAR